MRLGFPGLLAALALFSPPVFGDEIQEQVDLLFDTSKPEEARNGAARTLAQLGSEESDPRIVAAFFKSAYLPDSQDGASGRVFYTLCWMKLPPDVKVQTADLVAFFRSDVTHPGAVMHSARFNSALAVLDGVLGGPNLTEKDRKIIAESIFAFIERHPDSAETSHVLTSLLRLGDRSKRLSLYIDRLLFLDPPPDSEYLQILARRHHGLLARGIFDHKDPDEKVAFNPVVYGLPLAKAYFELNQPYEVSSRAAVLVEIKQKLADLQGSLFNRHLAEGLGLEAYVDSENGDRLNEEGERRLLGFALKRSFNDDQWMAIQKARQKISAEGFVSRDALRPAIEELVKVGIPRTQRRKLIEVLFPSTTWSTANRSCDLEFERLRQKARESES